MMSLHWRPGLWLQSLRVRLLAGTLLWIALTIVVAGWGLNHLFREYVQQQFQAELNLHLNQLTAVLNVDHAGTAFIPEPLSDPRFQQPFSGFYWQIDRLPDDTDPGQVGVQRSRSLWDGVLTIPTDTTEQGDDYLRLLAGPDGQTLLVLKREVQPPEDAAAPYLLIVAAEQRFMTQPLARFTRMLWLSLTLLAVGLVLAVVVQLLIGLHPLAQLRRQLAAVRDGDAPSIEGHFPTEVQPLVDEFNGVLSRNAQVVSHARTQAGNLAHAVKTPLSILANAAEQDNTDFGRLVREQTSMARRQVDYHLMRARAAAAVQVTGLRTPIRQPLEALVRVMARLHAESTVKIDLILPKDDLIFKGEEQDLQEMLGNLLDNACKWAVHQVVVGVRRLPPDVQHKDARLLFTVDDDGKGLAADQMLLVFKRGVRADEMAPGSGLGLAIVRDLAQLYGGDAQARTSHLGGLGITLSLPAA
ncbi:sensor histidine kinase [Alcaligenaceae bacterium]|nr:sensor histidine kinase [Alcaligenaceae bacterium]